MKDFLFPGESSVDSAERLDFDSIGEPLS